MEVTKEDQTNINSFSKLYLKKQELEGLIKLKKELSVQNEDAITEIEMNGDDEIVPTRFGVCFINISSTQQSHVGRHALDFLEGDQAKLKAEIKELVDSHEDTLKRMSKLKATLYGKFGNSINLDE